jgi:hypothetical protein
MTQTAYLHIGLPKTGTTYLQHVVWENKPRLARAGLLVPGQRHRAHLHASLDIRESDRLEKRAGAGATPWQDLVDEAQAWSGDILITHEFFCAASPAQVERMVSSLAGFEVRVIVTARSLNRLAVSRWQEWVKNGGTREIDDFPVRDRFEPADDWGWNSIDLADVLERWGAVIPHDRITVIVVDTSADPGLLWERFAAVVGVEAKGYPPAEEPRNTSLGVVEVELLRRVNTKLDGFKSAKDRAKWIRRYLGEGTILPSGSEKFRASTRKHQEFAARDRRAVEFLTTGGFNVDGDVALLETDTSPNLRQPGEVTDSELVEAATAAIANLLSDVRTLTGERDALRERVERAAAGPLRKRRWAR